MYGDNYKFIIEIRSIVDFTQNELRTSDFRFQQSRLFKKGIFLINKHLILLSISKKMARSILEF